MDATALQATFDRLAADYVKRLRLRIETVSPSVIHSRSASAPMSDEPWTLF